MKRSLIYCISIILVIVLLSVSAFAATITDSGMEASPYLITNEAELQQLETNVKYGKSYSGKYFRGSNDITLTQAWTPIGTASTPFCGIFDGNGKTISAMTVSGDHSALFAYIGSGAMDSYTGSDMPWSQHITDIQKVVIEAGVTAIGNYTFTRCAELGSITPSQRVNTLGDDAYSKCAGLTEGKQYSLGNEVLVSQTEIPATGHIATGPDGIDVPADTLQPDCTTSIQCNICGKVVLAALGHRVVGTGTVVVDPLTIDNTADAPFLLSGSRYTSSNKSDNSSSDLNITAQYDCTLTLNYGVSSEVYYDKLLILLNDAEQVDISGEKSGTTTLTLSAGDMVTVRYQKDSSNNIGKDEGWVELVYDKFEVETQVDIPADQAEPDCTNAVVCHYCNTVVKEALGHRVYIDRVPENPLVIDNTSAYPFSEEDGVYTSTNKNHSTTSELTITVAHPGTLKLLYGVSSEIYYDYMYILHKDRRTVFDGDSSDLTLELDVKTGDVIIIGYLKDSSNSSGSDCCWVSWEYTADPLLVPADSVQADCSTDLTCDICQALIKPAGHTEVVDKAVAATCTEAGLTEGKHCSVCGEVLVAQNIVDALGHTPAAAVEENRVESTCTVAGSYEEVVYCSACNAELSRETKALELAAHTPGEAVVENNVDATCGVDGSYDSVVHCSVCTTHVISSTHVVVPATGNHDWTDGQCTVCQKVCEHNYVDGTCSVCGDKKPVDTNVPVPTTNQHFFDYQIGLIEPWFLRINFLVMDSSGKVVSPSQMQDYGAYAIRMSQLENAESVIASSDYTAILEAARTTAYTKGVEATVHEPDNHAVFKATIYGSDAMSFRYRENIYTYEMGDPIVYFVWYIDADGLHYSPIYSQSIIDLVNTYKDRTNIKQDERDVYYAMSKLYDDLIVHRGSGATTLPTSELYKVGEANLGAPTVDNAYTFMRDQQIILLEPWGLRVNGLAMYNNTVLDYNDLEDCGVIVYHAKDNTVPQNAVEMLSKSNAYVFSKKLGNAFREVLYGSPAICARYRNEIYTYELDSTLCYMFYVVKDGNYYYSNVLSDNIKTLTENRASSGNYKETEREVYKDILQLYETITIYRKTRV